MKFFAVIQARLSSKRLPAKVSKSLNPPDEKPQVLQHLVDRVLASEVDEIIIAVPDMELERFQDMPFNTNNHVAGADISVAIKGGATHNVLDRFLNAVSEAEGSDYLIRITADNPFIDVSVLNENMNFVRKYEPDYSYPAWLPLGLGFEICRVQTLRSLTQLELKSAHREHVTTHIKENQHDFKVRPMELSPETYPFPLDIRLTIDEPADLRLSQSVYQYFSAQGNSYFSARDIIQLYFTDHSFFLENQHVRQKSYFASEKAVYLR